MSKANFKLNAKNIELKRKYHEVKMLLKESVFDHRADVRKLKDLMKAKDMDNMAEIARLQSSLPNASPTNLQARADKFAQLHKDKTPSNGSNNASSENKKIRNRQSRKQRTPTNSPNTNDIAAKTNVVSVSPAPPKSPMH
jgi:hypothetical protein